MQRTRAQTRALLKSFKGQGGIARSFRKTIFGAYGRGLTVLNTRHNKEALA